MVDKTRLLDAVVGGLSKAAARSGGGAGKPSVADAAQAALVGVAGLFLTSRRTRGITGSGKLGSLALLGGLAYKAYQNYRHGKPLVDVTPPEPAPQSQAASSPQPASGSSQDKVSQELAAHGIPQASGFHPVSQTEDDALLYLRAMVAAAAADGQIDEAERSRIVKGLTEAGIDPEASRWLETEMASPADVEELAATVDDPEKAAQVYAAARIAIDPDTIQEREFLNQLAAALDLEPAVQTQIDDTAGTMR